MLSVLRRVLLGLLWVTCSPLFAATDWSTQDYNLYPGDFNADGRTDLLYIAKDPSHVSGIALSDGSGPNTPWQSWPSNYLGIPWYGDAYVAVVADFNGDRRADIFLQRNGAGDHFLLLTDAQGKITGFSQRFSNGHLGLDWGTGQHRIIAGDFNADGRADLFLQSTNASGLNAVMLSDAYGQFTASAAQSWNDGFLGFRWNTQEAIIHAGNFNGSGGSDLLIQARPKIAMIDYEVPFPVPTYPPNMNGVLYAQSSGALFQVAGMQAWSRNAFGVDWSSLSANLLIGDFNGDGTSDVMLQALHAGRTSYLVTANASGAAFGTGSALASDVSWSANGYLLLAGNFDGSGGVGVFLQTRTPGGTNFYANTVTGSAVSTTVHDAAAPTGVVPASSVGHTPGSFAVSDSGSATYSIPIAVPPGVSGVQPSVTIAYDSNGGNGVLGVGWHITGLSQISRCNKTLVQDGSTDTVLLTTADRFCLDGNKLRLTSGAYGLEGSTYQTELEQFSRVTAKGSASGGPAYFTVESKDGLKYEYGSSDSSRIEVTGTSTPHTWAVSRISDRGGNTMTISYEKESGSFRPKEMLYTSNDNASLSAAYKVVFQWESRPDAITGYVAGGLVTESKRLNRIETWYNDPEAAAWRLVRKYQLSYNAGSASSRSRLASVQECDRNGSCLSPTMISWQDGAAGWASAATGSSSDSSAQMQSAISGDIDGDGRDDLIYPQASTWWFMRANSSGGFNSPVNTGVNIGNGYSVPVDYFSEGQLGLLVSVPGYSTRQLLRWDGSTLARLNTNITQELSGREWLADFDGDARPDFLYAASSGTTGYLYVQKNSGSTAASGSAQFGSAVSFYSTPIGAAVLSLFVGNSGDSSSRAIDFNGDSRADFIYQKTESSCGTVLCSYTTTWTAVASTGSSFTSVASWTCSDILAPCSLTPIVGDFNADGLTDLLISSGYPYTGQGYWGVVYGSGNGLTALSYQVLPTDFNTDGFAVDYDGDGRTDLLYAPSGSANWKVLLSTGTGFQGQRDTSIPSTSDNNTARVLDLDGDGQSDVGLKSGSYQVRKHNGAQPDLVSAITDGFGNNVSLIYAPLTDGAVYTKGGAVSFPEVNLQIPVYVVKQYSATDAAGGTYSVSETYSGARSHQQGRGHEGFATRSEIDARTGIQTEWVYRQDFPFTGEVAQITVKQPNGGSIITQTVNELVTYVPDAAANNQRWFPYVYQSVQRSYEVGGAANGQLIRVGTTTNGYDIYGNQTSLVTLTEDPVSGQSFKAQSVQGFVAELTNWCVNLATSRDEYHAILLNGAVQSQQQRELSFTPDSNYQKCRLESQTTEPTVTEWAVNTKYEYDSFGHVTSERITAADIEPRTTSMSYGAQGVFPVSVTNAAGETSTKTHDYALGVVLTATDPNGIKVSTVYDNFGRQTRQSLPDGTATTWTLYSCGIANAYCGDSLLRYQILEQHLDSTGGLINYQIRRFDAAARMKYEESSTLSGALAVVKTAYDNQGRLLRRSHPYFAGAAASYSVFTYDLLDRPLTEKQPVDAADIASTYPYCNTCRTTEYTYGRLSLSLKDANGKVVTKSSNAIGETVQVTDAGGGVTKFEYHPFGHLLKTTDPAGNIISATYDVRGFKEGAVDPDMGTWSYKYYATGELKTQTDATGQTTAFTYDGLSRPLTRVEAEGTTRWTYGDSASSRNIGKLKTISSPGGHSESYVYDSLGRVQDVTTTIDGASYVVSNTYDVLTGMLDTITYPTSTAAVTNARFKVKQEYANGILQRVKDANSGAVFWEQVAADASGRTVDEKYGNALNTYSTYDPVNGFLEARFTGSSNQIQNLAYEWDALGNLTERKDLRVNLAEHFYYDNLDRLDRSTLNGTQNLKMAYDAIGNITSKSDVGAYTYHATQKHAVVSAGSGHSYAYDANGNMTSRDGSTIVWTSYNLPSVINQGGSSAQFFYDASRSRYKQVSIAASGGVLPAGTQTTIYVGGLFEKVTKPSTVTEYKHYIFAGKDPIAVRTIRSNDSYDTRYLHKDHLGSIDTVTDEVGAVVLRESFDAFGRRRNASTWSGTPPASDWTTIAATISRGFTFHEQLDTVGLVHMNGRVYDPLIGRFLSADPNIQDGTNSQMLNRYSYVTNNPLSYTDPSGFFLKKLFKKVKKFIKQYGGTIISVAFAVMGMPFVGALLSSAFSTAVNHGSFGSFLKGFAIGAVAGAVGGQLGGKLAGFFGAGGSSLTAQIVRGAIVGGLAGGIGSVAMGGTFLDGFTGGAISGGITAGFVAKYGAKSEWTAEDQTAARASEAVYADETGGLLSSFGIKYAPSDGFGASLTLGPDGQYILAFRGTSPTSWANWRANLMQALGFRTSQYDQAVALAQQVHAAVGGNVLFTGHSLGGGLASAAARATGGRAITFNAAGLGSAYSAGSDGDIRAHYIRGDVLTMVQGWTPAPNAVGTPIPHNASIWRGPLTRHFMDNFPK